MATTTRRFAVAVAMLSLLAATGTRAEADFTITPPAPLTVQQNVPSIPLTFVYTNTGPNPLAFVVSGGIVLTSFSPGGVIIDFVRPVPPFPNLIPASSFVNYTFNILSESLPPGLGRSDQHVLLSQMTYRDTVTQQQFVVDASTIVSVVPEPSALVLIGGGLAGVLVTSRWRRGK
jgi:hypothetical protein